MRSWLTQCSLRWGEALDLVDCGFMLLDQDMRVRSVNDAFVQLIAIEQPMSFGVRLRDLSDRVPGSRNKARTSG